MFWAELLSRVQLFATPSTVAHQASLSMRMLQARILELGYALLQGIFPPRDRTQVSHTAGGFFTIWATREAPSVLRFGN